MSNDSVFLVLGWFEVALALFIIGLMLCAFIQAKRVRREAGELLIAPVRIYLGKPWPFRPWINIVFFLALLVNEGMRFGIVGVLIVVAVFLLGIAVYWGASQRGIFCLELRETGVVLGGTKLTPWPLIRRYRWQGASPVHLKLQFPTLLADLPLRDDDRDSVERVLAVQLANHDKLEMS